MDPASTKLKRTDSAAADPPRTEAAAARAVRQATEEIIIAMARVRPGTLAADTRLVGDLGYDSLRLIELAIAIELRLGLPIGLEHAITATTAGDMTRLVLELSGLAS